MGIEITVGKKTFVPTKSSHAEPLATAHMKGKTIASMDINEYPCLPCIMHLVHFAKSEKRHLVMNCTAPATHNYWDGGPALIFNQHRSTLTANGPGNCTLTFLSSGAIQLNYGAQPALRVVITKYTPSKVTSDVST